MRPHIKLVTREKRVSMVSASANQRFHPHCQLSQTSIRRNFEYVGEAEEPLTGTTVSLDNLRIYSFTEKQPLYQIRGVESR